MITRLENDTTWKPGAVRRSLLLPWRAAEDRAELRAALSGDRSAFETLMERHADALRSFLSNKVHAEQLDDMQQDVWLACWQGVATFDGRCTFRTWLFSIAMNKVRNHWKSRARTQHEQPLLEFHLSEAAQQAFDRTESEETIRAMLNTLSHEQREVLDLYYRSEFNLPEVAKILNRNLNTVKYQFYRAHECLAENLDREVRA